MTEIKDILDTITDMQIDLSKVLLCNAETKKELEKSGKIPSNVYILEDNRIEKNQIMVVKSREMKKLFIEVYEDKRRKEAQRE